MGHQLHPSGQFKPIETRHHDIGYHEIDVPALAFQQGPRVKPIAGLNNTVPVLLRVLLDRPRRVRAATQHSVGVNTEELEIRSYFRSP